MAHLHGVMMKLLDALNQSRKVVQEKVQINSMTSGSAAKGGFCGFVVRIKTQKT